MRNGSAFAGIGVVLAGLIGAVPAVGATPRSSSGDLLNRLDNDSAATVIVDRRPDGTVAMVRARGGRALIPVAPGASRGDTARAFAHRYGGALRAGGGVPDLRLTGAAGAPRLQQYVDGLPVVAGEVVVDLDSRGAPAAMAGELAEEDTFPDARVTAAQARSVAQRALARSTGATAVAAPPVRWAYDPALVGDAAGPTREVWRVRTASADAVDDVLVDAASGAVVLRVPLVEHAAARVCDDHDVARGGVGAPCGDALAVRGPDSSPSGNGQADAAYDGIATAIAEWGIAGRDLAEMIGSGTAGARVIESWVRWCDFPDDCPMNNAYWDGTRIYLGDDYALANDVVDHELAHGVVSHTANLMSLHESGALNESIADIFGELADQQDPSEGDSAWTLGESVPGVGALRSMANPPLHGQPDKMTSALYGTHDAMYDSGDVHRNDGIGNKTAWLIAHGGTFNGRTVASIDAGDPTYSASLRLWSGALDLLTSGSEYADLAPALEATCDQLAAAGAERFDDATCVSVRTAVAATELRSAPTAAGAAAKDVSAACPSGDVRSVLLRDDDARPASWNRSGYGTGADRMQHALWQTDPDVFGLPPYAAEGRVSWIGLDPDPAGFGDDPTGMLTAATAVTVPPVGRTYLRFRHAYLLDYDATHYYDGGRVSLLTKQSGVWKPATASVSWVNGPNRTLTAGASGTGPAFSGDSRGWGSSRMDLTSLAGSAVRPRFTVSADSEVSMYGWWVDGIELYTCGPATPTVVRSLAPHGTATGTSLSWSAPAWSGNGISGYRISRSDGDVRTYPATARAAVYPTLPSGSRVTFGVAPINASGLLGPVVRVTVVRTRLSSRVSATRVVKGRTVTVSGTLRRADTGASLAGRTVILQRRLVGGTGWSTLASKTTSSSGLVRFAPVVSASADYRLVFRGSGPWVGVTSASKRVTLR